MMVKKIFKARSKATGIILMILMIWATPAISAVYEIHPGSSFKNAVEALGPGDTLIVHEGTYSEGGSRIRITAKATKEQPILIKGADGEARPLITRPADSPAQNTINIEGATYITISHLEISGNGDGINMKDEPHHITIDDNEIHHIDVGINFRSSMSHITVRRNHIHHTNGTAEGMYIGCHDGDCQVSRCIIENNWIHDTYGSQGDGIEVKVGSWGNIIRDNVIHDAKQPCILVYGVPDAHVDEPNIIEGNAVWNCPQGIDVMADAVVRNNVAIGAMETQNHSMVPTPRNVTIVNNTIIGDLNLKGWGTGASTLTVANNVIYDGGINNAPAAATYSSNLVYALGGEDVFIDTVENDYWPAAASPLLGAADSAHTPTTDFNGNPRTPPFDVGAYDTEGLAANPGWAIQSGFKDSMGDNTRPGRPMSFRVE